MLNDPDDEARREVTHDMEPVALTEWPPFEQPEQ